MLVALLQNYVSTVIDNQATGSAASIAQPAWPTQHDDSRGCTMAEWEHQGYGRDRDSDYEHDRARMTQGGRRETRERWERLGGYGRESVEPWRQPGSHGGYQRPGYGREGSARWAQQSGDMGYQQGGYGGWQGGSSPEESERRWQPSGFGGGQQRGAGGPYVGKGPKGYRRSDERIKEDVCEYLAQHGEVDASDIEVYVQDGEVTLTGTVDSRRVKRMAEDAAELAAGVREIHNQLRVRDSQRIGLDQERQFEEQGKRVDRAA
jgi:hypothetical protein